MLKILYRYIISIAILTIGIMLIPTSWCDIHYLFKSTLRSTFFSSFLTMGSFTLSLMTMFMFSLKDKLFDDKKYVEDIEKTSKELGQKINRYNSLVMISQLFLFCVFLHMLFHSFSVSLPYKTKHFQAQFPMKKETATFTRAVSLPCPLQL